MSKITFKKKPRKQGAGLYSLPGDDRVFVGRDWTLQHDIDDAKAKTKERACFSECRTCGACSNSKRDQTDHYSYDANEAIDIDCRTCEPFRFHDCHNGWMRDSRQEAEPFTEEAQKLFKKGGKPLI